MRRAAILPLFLLLLLGSAGTTAQAPPAPPPAGAGDLVVIHAGTLLDRPGRPPRRNASILVRGNRIEAVQDGSAAARGARLIDLSDRFVLPGLIDLHVHLTSDRPGSKGSWPRSPTAWRCVPTKPPGTPARRCRRASPRSAIWASDDGVTPGRATPSTAAGR